MAALAQYSSSSTSSSAADSSQSDVDDEVVHELPSSLLRDAAHATRTVKDYAKAVHKFLDFAGLTPASLIHDTSSTIDRHLSLYLEHLYASTSGSLAYAGHTLHGVRYYAPRLKWKLPEAALRMRGFQRLRPSIAHPPFPWHLAVLLACTMANSGHARAGLAVLIAFDCYLRIGELTSLRVCDVLIPRDERLGPIDGNITLRLPKTKTGPNQSVAVDRPALARLLCECIEDMAPMDRVFACTQAHFRQLMASALSALSVDPVEFPFTPHSLRHGGATHDTVVLKRPAVEVLNRGRWNSEKSAKRYKQRAAAVDLTHSLPLQLDTMGARLAPHIETLMRMHFL